MLADASAWIEYDCATGSPIDEHPRTGRLEVLVQSMQAATATDTVHDLRHRRKISRSVSRVDRRWWCRGPVGARRQLPERMPSRDVQAELCIRVPVRSRQCCSVMAGLSTDNERRSGRPVVAPPHSVCDVRGCTRPRRRLGEGIVTLRPGQCRLHLLLGQLVDPRAAGRQGRQSWHPSRRQDLDDLRALQRQEVARTHGLLASTS